MTIWPYNIVVQAAYDAAHPETDEEYDMIDRAIAAVLREMAALQ